MREVVTMWRYTQMVVLVALSGAIYAAVLIPFQGIPIIPGFTSVRPGSALPIVLGLLFGPAGAWGSAFGNLIADFFGTLSLGSFGGFVGNFFMAYVPYKIWGSFFRRNENMEPTLKSAKKLTVFVAVGLLASTVSAVIIGWWLDLLGLVPFAALATIITVNNAIPTLVLAPLLLIALYPRVKRWGLLWTEVMEPEEVSTGHLRIVGNALMWIGGIGGLIVGLLLALGIYGQDVAAAGFDAGGAGGIGIGLGLVPFLTLIALASFMLGGREQMEATTQKAPT